VIQIEQPNSRVIRMLTRLAIENPGTRTRYKMSAGIVYRRDLVATGVNSYKSHPLMTGPGYNSEQIFMHAEVMSYEEPPVYEVDEQTREILINSLNWMLQFADVQLHEESGLKIQAAAEELAIRFDLPIQKIEIVKDEDGEWNVTIDGAREELEEREQERKRPSLSVIEGGKNEDEYEDNN